ncbi:hypothetical protein EJ08DRAFT_664562 [Tothia fuscella]|uniref:Probable treble clef zinc finger fungi domain-containing protein n=1 Tax=Tothia fuscella TaxID=1048955 RepID=A0A9P4NJ46_9PEZI|nr:hypothetical protein EJ08DRAFT_664562 [Tothia fuscella]
MASLLNGSEYLPTCKTHQLPALKSVACTAQLECGYPCGQLLKWKEHGFPLCADHEDFPKECYFFKIPTEIRCRIYEFLLPDKSIPARVGDSFTGLRADYSQSTTRFLGTCHQIHNEAVDTLYNKSTFAIAISNSSNQMCNNHVTTHNHQPPPFSGVPGQHALQDYQMQLMLLEQQNKKRLLMARSNNMPLPPLPLGPAPVAQSTLNCAADAQSEDEYTGAFGSIWLPTLAKQYFDMIRSFEINIELPPKTSSAIFPRHFNQVATAQQAQPNEEQLQNYIYEICDQLHQVMGRLELIKPSILHLNVKIVIEAFQTLDEALAAAQILLKPFKRLRNVANAEVHVSWKTSDIPHNFRWVHISTRDETIATPTSFFGYLRRWQMDLSSAGPLVEPSPTTASYWIFRNTVKEFMSERFAAMYTGLEMDRLIRAGRVAREADDLVGLHDVIAEFKNKWSKVTDEQRRLEDRVACSLDFIGGMMGYGGSEWPTPARNGEGSSKGKEKVKVEEEG